MEILSAALTLLLIMDPIGNVPLFLALTKKLSARRRRFVLLREKLVALIIMLGFLFFGQHFLDLFGLQPEAISIAGGIILFLIALKMIFPPASGWIMGESDEGDAEPFIVPLAIPFIAGPSILASLLLMAKAKPDQSGELFLALMLAWVASAIVLFASTTLNRVLGHRGLRAMERLMGMILIMLAVQMLLNGIAGYVRVLQGG